MKPRMDLRRFFNTAILVWVRPNPNPSPNLNPNPGPSLDWVISESPQGTGRGKERRNIYWASNSFKLLGDIL